jgi:aspartate/methionine/tyrosine aminotransferase
MFSSRLRWNLEPNLLTRLLQSRRESGATILDLTESNPTRAGLNYPQDAILDALTEPDSLVYEPSPAGLLHAREAVSAYYSARGVRVAPERIVLTASTSEAYAYLFKLLTDPGDEVLVPRPSYPLFDFLAALESVRPVAYPLEYHGCWSLDLDALRAAVSPRTRALVLVNPNNPTGSFIKRAELGDLLSLCVEKELAIISDEVFSDYTFAPDAKRVPTLAGAEQVLTFCFSGLSKIAGLPQMKVGWIVLSGPPAQRQAALERLELIADTYLSVSTPIQHAAPRLLGLVENIQQQIQQRVRSNLESVRFAVGPDFPCRVLDVEGGWYATIEIPRTRTDEQWCIELLERDAVLVQPGFFYDFPSEAYLVVSLLTSAAKFEEGIGRLLARVAS